MRRGSYGGRSSARVAVRGSGPIMNPPLDVDASALAEECDEIWLHPARISSGRSSSRALICAGTERGICSVDGLGDSGEYDHLSCCLALAHLARAGGRALARACRSSPCAPAPSRTSPTRSAAPGSTARFPGRSVFYSSRAPYALLAHPVVLGIEGEPPALRRGVEAHLRERGAVEPMGALRLRLCVRGDLLSGLARERPAQTRVHRRDTAARIDRPTPFSRSHQSSQACPEINRSSSEVIGLSSWSAHGPTRDLRNPVQVCTKTGPRMGRC